MRLLYFAVAALAAIPAFTDAVPTAVDSKPDLESSVSLVVRVADVRDEASETRLLRAANTVDSSLFMVTKKEDEVNKIMNEEERGGGATGEAGAAAKSALQKLTGGFKSSAEKVSANVAALATKQSEKFANMQLSFLKKILPHVPKKMKSVLAKRIATVEGKLKKRPTKEETELSPSIAAVEGAVPKRYVAAATTFVSKLRGKAKAKVEATYKGLATIASKGIADAPTYARGFVTAAHKQVSDVATIAIAAIPARPKAAVAAAYDVVASSSKRIIAATPTRAKDVVAKTYNGFSKLAAAAKKRTPNNLLPAGFTDKLRSMVNLGKSKTPAKKSLVPTNDPVKIADKPDHLPE